MERNMRNTILKVLLVFFVALLIFVISFVVYYKVFNGDNGGGANNGPDPALKYSQEDFDTIIMKFQDLLNKKSLDELTNQEKLRFLIGEYTGEDRYTTFNQSSLDEIHRNSIIKNLTVTYEDLYNYYGTFVWDQNSVGYEYDSEKQTFTYTGNLGHGAVAKGNIINKELVSFDFKDGVYIVSYKYILYNTLGEGPADAKLYLTIDDALNEKNEWVYLTIGEDDSIHSDEFIKEHYEDVIGILPIYTYTFKEENNSLIITDFSIN